VSLLTPEERKLLTKAVSLMDELVETLEIMSDEEMVRDLKQALKEVKEGKTRPLSELIKELNLEGEI
jgi:RNA polymerase-interacting CarD/CdnL/TRCF family regulator